MPAPRPKGGRRGHAGAEVIKAEAIDAANADRKLARDDYETVAVNVDVGSEPIADYAPPTMPSFDIASKPNWPEIDNALNQAQKEIAQRFDFKDTGTELEKNTDGILILASTDDRARAALGVLQDKLVKRKVALRFLDPQKPEKAPKGTSKMLVKVKEGIEVEVGREIVKLIKDQKLKVQGSITEAQVRVTGKNRDDLQACMQAVRAHDFGVELQFVNFRD